MNGGLSSTTNWAIVVMLVVIGSRPYTLTKVPVKKFVQKSSLWRQIMLWITHHQTTKRQMNLDSVQYEGCSAYLPLHRLQSTTSQSIRFLGQCHQRSIAPLPMLTP